MNEINLKGEKTTPKGNQLKRKVYTPISKHLLVERLGSICKGDLTVVEDARYNMCR